MTPGWSLISWLAQHSDALARPRRELQESQALVSTVSESGRGRPDKFYAQIAQEYVNLWTTGRPHPIAEISTRRSIPKGKVRDMVREARRRGLLTPGTGRGRIGGQLTPRALAYLKEG